MPQFDEQAAHLPPPRADEPANLRREIIDELSDHLTCARKREQLAGGPQTEEAIQHRVLNRFGDPAAVARKLWFDWMWEKTMTQRILTGVCILLAVVTCAALAFAWVSINRQQDLIAELQSTSQTQLQEQQKQFERLLGRSERMLLQNSAKPSPSMEWNPIELKFVGAKENGPPLPGVNVTLEISAEGSGIPPLQGVSDAQGIVRFERVHYGIYRLRITTPSGEFDTRTLTQQPGEALSTTIICPYPPGKPVAINARIQWPENLTKQPLWFRFKQQAVYRPIEDHLWKGSPLTPETFSEVLLVQPNGAIFGTVPIDALHISYVAYPQKKGRAAYAQTKLPVIQWGRINDRQVVDYANGILWPGAGYEVRDLEVLIPIPDIETIDDLREQARQSDTDGSRPLGVRREENFTGRQIFYAVHLRSAGWPHRVETGIDDKPGTLWLTPTAEAIEKVRTALAEIDQARETAEKAQAEAEKARGQSEQPATNGPDVAKEDTDSK